MNYVFFLNSAMLGIGLAMDAFSVSCANGLNEPEMKLRRMSFIAGVYALFQFGMPMIGWICVHSITEYFTAFQKFIPWIALVLLLYIGGKMLVDGIRGGDVESEEVKKLTFTALMIQGVATSIDALSVGFTIAGYNLVMAIVSCLVIGIETFFICLGGLLIGKKVGTKLAGKASILGGIILIAIGIEIFVSGAF